MKRDSIPTLAETSPEIIYADEWVKVRWWNNKEHYESRGYKFTKKGEYFLCHIDDLSHNTAIKVRVVCPLCRETRRVPKRDVVRSGNSYCRGHSHVKNLLGQRFSMLTAIEFLKTNTTGSAIWKWQCDCGNVCEKLAKSVLCGDTQSCGCYKDQRAYPKGEDHPNFVDLTGEIFGRLTVTEYQGRNDYGGYIWLCKCECGNTCIVARNSLRSGGTRSCGCLHRDKPKGPKHWLYNPNITKEQRDRKRTGDDHKWRDSVYERDNYTCQVCGQRGGKIRAHHLFCHRDYPELRLDIDNGITLCVKDHKSFHKWMGGFSVSVTSYDFYEWAYWTKGVVL